MPSELYLRTLRHTSAFLVVVLAAVLTPRVAAAQDEAALTAARLHFEAGQAEYAAGRFEDALADFQAAYATTAAPEILYNIATILDRLRRDSEAADAYERYLAAVPASSDRANLTARVTALRAALARGERAPDPVVVAPPPTEPQIETTRPVVETPHQRPRAEESADSTGWIVFGVGLGVAAVGGVLLGVAEMDAASVRSATFFPDVRSANDRVPIESGVGWSALAVGIAAAGLGLVLALTSGSGDEPGLAAIVGPSSVGLRVRL